MSTLATLKAVRQRCVGAQSLGMIPGGHFENMRDQFLEAAALVMEEHPATRSFKPQDYRDGFDNPISYHKRSVQSMIVDIDYFIGYLSSLPAIESTTIEFGEQGIFLPGQSFDALFKFDEIISIAQNEVVFIDGFVNGKILGLLKSKRAGVTCRILTKPTSLDTALRTFIDAFNKQEGGLEVRTSEYFHDRFIVVDGARFYHFGSSLKDAGKRGFMYTRIEERSLQEVLWKEFEVAWSNASK